MPLPPPLHLPWPRPLLLPLQLLGSRLGWCSIARLRDSVGTPFIVVRELWLALIPGRAYRPRSKSVGRVLRCCPGKLRYGYSQIGSIGRTVGPGAAADLGGIWTRSGWSSGIRLMMWSEIMSELQAWRAGACIASRCTKRLCLAIGAPAIPCDTCSPIGQQIMACYRAAILTLLQSSHTSPPQLLMVRVAFLLRLESGALDSLHLIWERLLYRPVGSAQRAPVAAPPDAMNS